MFGVDIFMGQIMCLYSGPQKKFANKKINVLYGGSVNIENISDILKINNVDGVLVGGASLKAKDFLAIYSAAVKHLNNSL